MAEPQKIRAIRVRDSVWVKAQERAEREGVTVAEVVRKYLERWGKG